MSSVINNRDNKISSSRLLSLDAFRGLTIFLMLLVNNIGVEWYTPRSLVHAGWSGGVHLADFVYPWFLFCVGVAVPFSVASFRRKNLPTHKYYYKIIKRTAILVLLGVIISSLEVGYPIFYFGILQTIGLAYCAGAFLYELSISRRLTVAACVLIVYWAILRWFPVPGIGAGVFEPGRNAIDYINREYLESFALDGLPLILPTMSLVVIGTTAGDIFRKKSLSSIKKSTRIILIGALLSAFGILWSLDIEFNKPIWTPSYVLLAAGTGAAILGVFYLIIDIGQKRSWSFPFIVFGSNAIFAYTIPIIIKILVLHKLGLNTGGWLRVSFWIIFWWIIMWLLYRKRIFLRV